MAPRLGPWSLRGSPIPPFLIEGGFGLGDRLLLPNLLPYFLLLGKGCGGAGGGTPISIPRSHFPSFGVPKISQNGEGRAGPGEGRHGQLAGVLWCLEPRPQALGPREARRAGAVR